MYLLAHAGVTLLAWETLRRLLPRRRFPVAAPLAVLVGALLPDLVDKPLGHLVLGWGTGRLFAHTALFVLLLALAALSLRRRAPRLSGVLAAFSFGSLAHLVLDRMWSASEVLWWPLLGPMPHGAWAPIRYLTTPFTSPWVLAMEAVGLLLLALLWPGLRGRLARVTIVKKPAPVRRDR